MNKEALEWLLDATILNDEESNTIKKLLNDNKVIHAIASGYDAVAHSDGRCFILHKNEHNEICEISIELRLYLLGDIKSELSSSGYICTIV